MVYPFTRKLFLIGLVAGVVGAFLLGSILAGYALFTVFAVVGLVWRLDEPPILPFALAFQWIFIVAGYLYNSAGGFLEEMVLGNVDLAIFLSLTGLIVIAFGLRLGIALLGKRLSQKLAVAKASESTFDLHTLFLVTIITYSVSWIIEISPMEIMFNAAQIIAALLSFREVLLCLLLLTILRQREGYRYGLIAFVIAVIPRFISKQSTFKELIFMVLIVALTEFRPWIKSAVQKRFHRRLAVLLVSLSVLLIILGSAWEGGIKPIWRHLEVEGSPTAKLEAFMQVSHFVATEMNRESWLQDLISRVSSITQFALVLDRVPHTVAHEDGRLTVRALKHIAVPRVLFPGKENLGTDSWMAEEFAGLKIGEDTSVGIGYMAEFYVDWGKVGMVPFLFGLGVFLGLAYGLIYLIAPTYQIARAVVIVPFITNFITYEATLPKLLGGFIMTSVFVVLLAQVLPRFLRFSAPTLQPNMSAVPAD